MGDNPQFSAEQQLTRRDARTSEMSRHKPHYPRDFADLLSESRWGRFSPDAERFEGGVHEDSERASRFGFHAGDVHLRFGSGKRN